MKKAGSANFRPFRKIWSSHNSEFNPCQGRSQDWTKGANTRENQEQREGWSRSLGSVISSSAIPPKNC